MSNAISPLVFRNAQDCFEALRQANPVAGTVVVIGNTPMQLEVGRYKDIPVALVPLSMPGAQPGRPQRLRDRFVAVCGSLIRHRGAPIAASAKQAGAILARAESARRERAWQSLWVRKAVASVGEEPLRGAGAAAASAEVLKERVIARFAPETALALASIRALRQRLPAQQADVLTRELVRSVAREYGKAIAQCRIAGMSAQLCKDIEDIVWGDLALEMATTRGTQEAKLIARFAVETALALASVQALRARLPAQQADAMAYELIRPIARTYRAVMAQCRIAGMSLAQCKVVDDVVWKDLATEMEAGMGKELSPHVKGPLGQTRQVRLNDAVGYLDEIDNATWSGAVVMRNAFATKCWADDPPEMHAYAAVHILTELRIKAKQSKVHEAQVNALLAMIRDSCPPTRAAVTAELAKQWDKLCAIGRLDSEARKPVGIVALAEGITDAIADILNGDAPGLGSDAYRTLFPLAATAEAIRQAIGRTADVALR